MNCGSCLVAKQIKDLALLLLWLWFLLWLGFNFWPGNFYMLWVQSKKKKKKKTWGAKDWKV